jgi:COMPASS component SWD3
MNHHSHYTCLPILGQHKKAVSCVSFAPTIPSTINTTTSSSSNGHEEPCICASASADGTVRLWDIGPSIQDYYLTTTSTETTTTTSSSPTTFNPTGIIMGHSKGINELAWNPRAPHVLATASDDKTCKVWDVSRFHSSSCPTSSVLTGSHPQTSMDKPLVELKGHSNFCFSVKFSPQGNLLVTGSFDETVKIWDVRTGECISTLPAHSDPVTGVDFNMDGTCIVSSSHDGLIRIWDLATGECLKTIYAEKNPPVSFVKYSPNGKYVLSGMLDGKLRLWDVLMKKSYDDHQYYHTHKDDHSQRLIAGRGGQCTKTYTGHVNSKYCVFSDFALANPKQPKIITGSEDGKVYIYDLQTRQNLQVLDAHVHDCCLAVAAHDTKDIIVTGGMSKDPTVKFWVPKMDDHL